MLLDVLGRSKQVKLYPGYLFLNAAISLDNIEITNARGEVARLIGIAGLQQIKCAITLLSIQAGERGLPSLVHDGINTAGVPELPQIGEGLHQLAECWSVVSRRPQLISSG